MVVVTINNCPPKLRGDLSKWLLEINTGVYCGNINARVRDQLWDRICENIHDGRATMVFSAQNEQHLDFKVYNADWEPIDYDGIKLIRHPARSRKKLQQHAEISNHSSYKQYKNRSQTLAKNYCVLDLETTGLSVTECKIIEIGILKIQNDVIVDQKDILVKTESHLPQNIINITGLSDAILAEQGIPLKEALKSTIEFIGKDQLVGYNINFDLAFINDAIEELFLPRYQKRNIIDVMSLAHQIICDVNDYKLSTVASHFKIDYQHMHRALSDCMVTFHVYSKLKKILAQRS